MGSQDITRDELLQEIARSMIAPRAEDGWFTAFDVWDAYQAIGNPDNVRRDAFTERIRMRAMNEGWEIIKFGRVAYYRIKHG